MSLASMLRSRVSLQRQAVTKDSSGGPVQTFAAVPGAVLVPCDIQPANARTAERFLRQQQEVDCTVFLSRDIGATSSDRLQDNQGRNYLIVEGGYQAGADGYAGWPAVAHVKRLT